MKNIKDLTVKVTYQVGLGDVEMPIEVYNQIQEATENGDEIDFMSSADKYLLASQWLGNNIKESDCMEWKAEIIEITEDDEVRLSDNLILTSVQENNSEDNVLITVECNFLFFGKKGDAYIAVEHLDDEDARYAMVEIDSEVFDSFENLIEKEENWKKIVEAVKKYIQYWKEIYCEEEEE